MALSAGLKEAVRSYWSNRVCGAEVSEAPKFSRQYFDEIEAYRYGVEPEIFAFAQFSRYYGQRVLEVGVGAGTDFVQWVRSGAKAHGVDLTEEAVEHVKRRLEVYGLVADDVRVADAESLPYADGYFDLVYSWGVIHHTPNTVKALEEIVRVLRPGGTAKVMVYNRRSLHSMYCYLYFGLLRGRPLKSISWILYNCLESLGTKAFTTGEINRMVWSLPVVVRAMEARASNYDLLWNRAAPFRLMAYLLACVSGFNRCGWFLQVEFQRK